ncbi:hypothetical protein ACWC0C_35745 [Streptomyces sp. NPDC001709]
MNRIFHTARKAAATAPVGRLAAGAVLLLAAVGTLGATHDLSPLAGHAPAGVRADDRWTSVRAADDPWTLTRKVVQRDDPWTSAPASPAPASPASTTLASAAPLRDDPWT